MNGTEILVVAVADIVDEALIHIVHDQTWNLRGLMMTSTSSLAVWSCISAGLLALLSCALILFPRLLLFLSQSNIQVEERSSLTNLESFLAVHLGVYLAATALGLILNVIVALIVVWCHHD